MNNTPPRTYNKTINSMDFINTVLKTHRQNKSTTKPRPQAKWNLAQHNRNLQLLTAAKWAGLVYIDWQSGGAWAGWSYREREDNRKKKMDTCMAATLITGGIWKIWIADDINSVEPLGTKSPKDERNTPSLLESPYRIIDLLIPLITLWFIGLNKKRSWFDYFDGY